MGVEYPTRPVSLQMKKSPRNAGIRSVLYEDDAVVVVDKPAGLAAVPVRGSDIPSALSLLSADLKRKRQRALVVHRIDRFTSGILLFAKTETDRDILVRQFLAHTPVRQYLAVIRGRLAAREGTLVHHFQKEGMFQKLSTDPLAARPPAAERRGKFRRPPPRESAAPKPAGDKDSEATRAELRYAVERPLRSASLVRVSLVTGLQNQIRAQFSAIGHPVIGDRKYHPEESSERRIDRVALHAAHLEFVHPRSKARISIDCDPPPDFVSLVQGLSVPTKARP